MYYTLVPQAMYQVTFSTLFLLLKVIGKNTLNQFSDQIDYDLHQEQQLGWEFTYLIYNFAAMILDSSCEKGVLLDTFEM